jgi:hypothetical protein
MLQVLGVLFIVGIRSADAVPLPAGVSDLVKFAGVAIPAGTPGAKTEFTIMEPAKEGDPEAVLTGLLSNILPVPGNAFKPIELDNTDLVQPPPAGGPGARASFLLVFFEPGIKPAMVPDDLDELLKLKGLSDFLVFNEIQVGCCMESITFDFTSDPLRLVLPTSLGIIGGVEEKKDGDDVTDVFFKRGTGPNGKDKLTVFVQSDVPEPSTLALFGIGALGLFGFSRRKVSVIALKGPLTIGIKGPLRTGVRVGAKSSRWPFAAAATLLVTALILSDPSWAAPVVMVTADIANPTLPVQPGGNATTTLLAFSSSGGVTNAQTQDFQQLKNGNRKMISNNVPQVNAPIKVKQMNYKPAVSLGAKKKIPAPFLGTDPAIETTFSSSPGGINAINAAVTGAGTYDASGNKPLLIAQAYSTGGQKGEAAGAAFDPIDVSPGSYSYNPTIDAVVQLGTLADSGGVTFFALDSRLSAPNSLDTFYDRGEPFNEALWSLSITENANVIDVSFAVNPAAISLDVLTVMHEGGALYTVSDLNRDVTDSILGAITVTGDLLQLTNFPLFPFDGSNSSLPGTTVYNVSDDVSYAAGINAGLSAVPEPSTLPLMGMALAGFAMTRKGKKGKRGQVLPFATSERGSAVAR